MKLVAFDPDDRYASQGTRKATDSTPLYGTGLGAILMAFDPVP